MTDWLTRARRLDVFVLTATLWFLAKFLRYAFPPLFGTFRDVYGVSNAELGVVFSALMVGYAVMQFPSGALADRVGTVRVITGGAVVTAVAAIVLSTRPTYLVLVGAVVLVGLGTGAHKTVAITLLSTVYTERTGRTLGAMDTIGELGGVVAPAVVVAILAASIDWSMLFLGGAVAGLVCAGLFARLVGNRLDSGRATPDVAPDGGDGGDGDGSSGDGGDGGGSSTDEADGSRGDDDDDLTVVAALRTYVSAFADPRFAAFVGVTMLFTFVMYGVAAFLPLYLTEVGLSVERAGVLYSGFFLVGIVQPATGDLADRIGELHVILGTLGLATVALSLLLAVGGAGSLVLGGLVLALGVGLHGTRPCRDAYLVGAIPDAVTGGTLGVVRTGMMAGGAVAPAVVGVITDWAGFTLAFAVLTAALVVAVALVAGLVVTRRPE